MDRDVFKAANAILRPPPSVSVLPVALSILAPPQTSQLVWFGFLRRSDVRVYSLSVSDKLSFFCFTIHWVSVEFLFRNRIMCRKGVCDVLLCCLMLN